MEYKLVKTDSGNYLLLESSKDVENGWKPCLLGKLSLKNCQVIEDGYDLDELAKNTYRNFPTQVLDQPLIHWNEDKQATKKQKAFIKGFKMRDKMLSDRLFTEDDLKNAILFGHGLHVKELWREDEQVEKYIQSLQQKEWNVKIIMKNSRTGREVKSDFDLEWDEDGLCDRAIPKLDSDGCLILKRA